MIMTHLKGLGILFLHSIVFLSFLSHCLHGCPLHELKTLLSIRNRLYDVFGELNSWEGDDCCTWTGVYCDEVEIGRPIYKLDVHGFGVYGNMSSSLLELKHLKHLDLGGNYFSWESLMPAGLGSLTNLTYLDMSRGNRKRKTELGSKMYISYESPFHNSINLSLSIQWLSSLPSLKYLAFNGLQLQSSEISSEIGSLSKLNHLELSECGLQGFTVLNPLVNLSFLSFLDLSDNSISGSIPSWMGSMTRLISLDLSFNALNGSIPPVLADLHFLTYLDLSHNILSGNIPSLSHTHSGSLSYLGLGHNKLEGTIPLSLGFHMNLSYIDLSYNKLSGRIPPVGNLSALGRLGLQGNHLSGTLPPSFCQLSSLTHLDMSNNVLNGSVHPSLMLPSSLQTIDLSSNSMVGMISEVLFQNTFSLEKLVLSDSGLSVNFSLTWIPPFQLSELSLRRCKIGGPIPRWISTQHRLHTLDLSNTSIVESLPPWLWGFSSELTSLNLSYNSLEGPFSPTLVRLQILDLSKNGLSGHLVADIDERVLSVERLFLADNKLEGKIPASLGNMSSLYYLDLSGNLLGGSIPASLCGLVNLRMLKLENNSLDGMIPASLGNLSQIAILNIANNHLNGRIPNELGNMTQLSSFSIQKNNIQGLLPLSLSKLSELQVLDVGENKLAGPIPDWIANLSSLRVLVMRYNKFEGKLPLQIGEMPLIQIIDLSSNLLCGEIPKSYFNFSVMTSVRQDFKIVGENSFLSAQSYYKDGLYVSIKGKQRHFEYILSSLACIDLSNNSFRGHLPPVIGNLEGLMFLSLSMNTLSGSIPDVLGNLGQLESLDLSLNKFSGHIPSQIGYLDYLGYLNVSYNNLSGRIPLEGRHMITFDNSSFLGNPNLWGCPLERNCSHPLPKPSPPPNMDVKEEKEDVFPWYEMSVGLSVGMGFSMVLTVLTLKVMWRNKCFEMMDRAVAFLFVKLFNW